MTLEPKDRVAIMLACTVGIFVAISTIGFFFLAYAGLNVGKGWAGLFSLMTAILGALAGWLGGTAYGSSVTKTKDQD